MMQAYVSHFRVDKAVHQFAVDQSATTNAGADGQALGGQRRLRRPAQDGVGPPDTAQGGLDAVVEHIDLRTCEPAERALLGTLGLDDRFARQFAGFRHFAHVTLHERQLPQAVGQFGGGKLRIYLNTGTPDEPKYGKFEVFQAGMMPVSTMGAFCSPWQS